MGHGMIESDWQRGTQQAWHGLTTLQTPDEMQLDTSWHMTKKRLALVPVLAQTPAGLQETGFMQPYAADIGRVVGMPIDPATYPPIAWLPERIIEKLVKALAGAGAKLASEGTFHDRCNWYVSLVMPQFAAKKVAGREGEYFLTLGRDIVQKEELFLALSHTVTVCKNTYKLNQQSACDTVKATKNSEPQVEQLMAKIDSLIGVQAEFEAAMESFAEKPCDINRAEAIFAGYVAKPNDTTLTTRAKNTVTDLTTQFRRAPGNEGKSLLDVFNSVTYANHYLSADWRGVKDAAEADRMRLKNEASPKNQQRAERLFNILTNDNALATTEKRGAELLLAYDADNA